VESASCCRIVNYPSRENPVADAGWYVKVASGVRGPASFEIVQKAAAAGKLKPSSLIRSGTDGPWVRAGTVDGLVFSPDRVKPQSPEVTEPEVSNPASPAAVVVLLAIALATAWSPPLVTTATVIIIVLTIISTKSSNLFVRHRTGWIRLAQLWLSRELVRLDRSVAMGPAFLVIIYSLLTSSLALGAAIIGGTSGFLDIMTAGGLAGLTGGALLSLLFWKTSDVEEIFSRHVDDNENLARQHAADVAERREQAAAERQRIEAEKTRQAQQRAVAESESPGPVPISRPVTSRPMVTDACWYCRQPHSESIQCPYCHMLA